ncbi:angiopoietin-2-like isoform X2 [Uranotaenia lowii]|uniref:angiopoietin-2-like isoform X2 n=1 Tax=Uranotaenia lowii TaxID=190385 RepID=UPI00247A1BF1|nr:angiopoietin-2-like isoform X2 [Uranotaenia lowii]
MTNKSIGLDSFFFANMLPLLALVIFAVQPTHANSPGDAVAVNDVRKQLQIVKDQLEQFNTQYFINLEQRMLTIMTTMTSLDSNVKTLQEKSQVWDVFHHHIGAWSDHIKSVDSKLDLLKKSQENVSPQLEARLSGMDFKIQHVFDKVDVINEKLHDITKTVYALSSSYRSRRNDRENADQGALLTKISNLQKQLNRLEASTAGCNKKNGNGNGNGNGKAKKEVQEFDDEVDDFLDKLATKKLKDLAVSRKQSRSLDSLAQMLRTVEERTERIYDLEANQFEQILSCCKRTDREITTFTNSADILLKRIERLVINVDGKIEKRNNQNCERRVEPPSEEIDEVIASTVELGSGLGDTSNSENNFESVPVESDEAELIVNFHQPENQGCHQLTVRESGVYTFEQLQLNEANRDFNRRYCYFATDGPAWTVIQRRKLHDIQENFNRTWADYRNGFGDLSHEFWFGNAFIHKLTYDDNLELRVELEDFDGNTAYAEYKQFRLDSEKFGYNLMVADYQGDASDSMAYHNDRDFSTFDKPDAFSCAITYGSGWWFNSCLESNLNGIYYTSDPRAHRSTGILWETWLGDYSLKSTIMMVRPRESSEDEDRQPQDP